MIEVRQEDRKAAAGACPFNIRWGRRAIAGEQDDNELVQAFAAHRQQAEDETRERCAAYVEGKGGVIPGSTVFISLITGDSMPCMSGDGRDKLNSHKRRCFDDATRDLATAIRGIDAGGEG